MDINGSPKAAHTELIHFAISQIRMLSREPSAQKVRNFPSFNDRLPQPGIELGTRRVEGECPNHYTNGAPP